MRNKREAFVRLAEARTNKVPKAISVLIHCANPDLYEYNYEEVKRMFEIIDSEIEVANARFKRQKEFHF